MSEEIRTFIAIDITDQRIIENLVKARDMLIDTGADLKPVAPENMHITIRFIGEIPLSTVNKLCSELKNLVFKPFKVRVKGIGVFPNITRPRVIWAGVTEGYDELTNIHEEVEKIVRKIGLPPDREKFIPHITLARVRSDRNIGKLVKVINNILSMDFGEYIVNKIVLKRSILTPSGPIYSDICGVEFTQ